jgi:RimJ/RimL family protein N-acetyltransferase
MDNKKTGIQDPIKHDIQLRDVKDSDLPIFFEQQQDPSAVYMAAFTAKDPADRQAFEARWDNILSDEGITIRTILFEGQVAGHILSHTWFGEPEVSYWLGKEFWDRGIATQALAAFLDIIQKRPLYARAAKDNLASIRVLEKCGFRHSRTELSFANARGEEIKEVVMVLMEER